MADLSEQDELELLTLERERAAKAPRSTTLPANAGLVKFGTTMAGLPVDAATAAINLGIAGAGALTSGLPGKPPDLIQKPVGGSQWLEDKLRATGEPGLSPDNPTPNSGMGKLQYDMTARGGFIPGGVIPALASIAAEKIGGPAWAPVGALAPSAATMAAKTVASKLAPAPAPAASLLESEGVQLTPGQKMGGAVKRAEDAATSFPVLGDAIKGAQRRGFEQFNEAALNRSLAPLGEKLPKGLKGNTAVEYVYGKLGDAYDALLPKLRGDLNARAPSPSGTSQATAVTVPNPVTANQPGATGASLNDELNAIKQMGASFPSSQRGQLNRIINNEVLNRFTPQGKASGETLKEIESQLGSMSKGMRQSDNYDVRRLGTAVEEVQNALRRMVNRVNPEYEGELAKVNEGYANFKRVQNAASSVGATEGTFTPAQLHRAVRAGDTSKDKARFAEGNALMQDLSSAGKAVLPSTVPDSGTPLRAAMMYALSHPVKASILGIPLGAASLAYTPIGQRTLQALLERRPIEAPPPTSGPLQAILSQQQGR